ncbi:hypothetical protein QP363_04905 [Corynebacterium sp. UMB6689]|uniref:hypothetical protein n=1 Tax=Corynebacterium TaxID=1716 RepID=UPI0008A3ACEE|nr:MULTISPECIES: hypothetical protein [Corynebacterium]MBE7339470.1 hypothetical protein [Corynebacterium aurimucosum]MDK6813345.1 hypothetical protein [Corynebacterium sp. UMB6689]OFP21474.1 hypothetical protein HMPREF2996_03515 [Corynebacterium sp. HMSC066C02]OFQ35909.1 hypothetical protein HMPREF2943_10620 [Corynebacterium sp. HMSC072D12]QQU96384.1 hypothetical protein I6I66_04610 [Corynebacterium aurimucosum]
MKIRRTLVALAAATSVAFAGAPAASAATYPEPLNQVMDQMVKYGGPQAPNLLLVPAALSSLGIVNSIVVLALAGSSQA